MAASATGTNVDMATAVQNVNGDVPKYVIVTNNGPNGVGIKPLTTGESADATTYANMPFDLPVNEMVVVNVAGYTRLRLICNTAETASVRITPLENQ